MRIEKVDLHGLALEEALEKASHNLEWCLKNGVDVLDIIHGKGHHSSRSFSVIKKEVRIMLKGNSNIPACGYKIIYGESNLPVALAYDEGHTLIVARGLENQYLGGKKEQEKNQSVFSAQGKKERKLQKSQRAAKRNRPRPSR